MSMVKVVPICMYESVKMLTNSHPVAHTPRSPPPAAVYTQPLLMNKMFEWRLLS